MVGFYPVAPEWWIPALSFSLLIWADNETRHYFIRLALHQETWLGDFLTMETNYQPNFISVFVFLSISSRSNSFAQLHPNFLNCHILVRKIGIGRM